MACKILSSEPLRGDPDCHAAYAGDERRPVGSFVALPVLPEHLATQLRRAGAGAAQPRSAVQNLSGTSSPQSRSGLQSQCAC